MSASDLYGADRDWTLGMDPDRYMRHQRGECEAEHRCALCLRDVFLRERDEARERLGWLEHAAAANGRERNEAQAEVARLNSEGSHEVNLRLANLAVVARDKAEAERDDLQRRIDAVRAVVDDPRATGGPMYDGYVTVRDVRRALDGTAPKPDTSCNCDRGACSRCYPRTDGTAP